MAACKAEKCYGYSSIVAFDWTTVLIHSWEQYKDIDLSHDALVRVGKYLRYSTAFLYGR